MLKVIEHTRSVLLVVMLFSGVSAFSAHYGKSPIDTTTGQHSEIVESDMFDFDRLDQQLEDSGVDLGGQEKDPGFIEVTARRIGMPIFLFFIWCVEKVSALCSRLYTVVAESSQGA